MFLALVPAILGAYAIATGLPLDFTSRQLGVTVVLDVCSFVLLDGAAAYYQPLTALPLLAYGVSLGVALVATLLLWRTPPNSPSLAELSLAAIVTLAYSCGLIFLVNGALATGPGRRVNATVASKRNIGTKTPSYVLRLSSPDPDVGNGDWRVNMDNYYAATSGGQACVDIYPGALGGKWYRAGTCPSQPGEVIPWAGFGYWFTYGYGSIVIYDSKKS